MNAAARRLFGEGFRAFFLAAGLFAIASLGLWEVWLVLTALGRPAPGWPSDPVTWHAHEMVFGYPAAALGGFFLTAVPNWTGARAARHGFIATAIGLWLAGRVAVALSGTVSPGWVALADLAFVPLLAAKIATQLIRRPKPQNLMFLALLALIWGSNLLIHLDWMGLTGGTAERGLRAGLLAHATLIAVLGGRIVPAFTRNALHRAGHDGDLPVSSRPAEVAGIAGPILLTLSLLAAAPAALSAALALIAGAAQIWRLAGWRSRRILGQPILWSLHAAFAMLGLGYLALGLSMAGLGSATAALHLLGIGAVGGMTIAVMSRATLGHTGRPLRAPRPVAIAYGLVLLAAGVRFAASAVPALHDAGVLIAGAAWTLAFVLYTIALWPAFWGPRADAQPAE